MERRDKRGRRIGRNWWREWIVDQLYCADHAWWLKREEEAIGYETEMKIFAEGNPRPTLKAFLIGHAGMHREP